MKLSNRFLSKFVETNYIWVKSNVNINVYFRMDFVTKN